MYAFLAIISLISMLTNPSANLPIFESANWIPSKLAISLAKGLLEFSLMTTTFYLNKQRVTWNALTQIWRARYCDDPAAPVCFSASGLLCCSPWLKKRSSLWWERKQLKPQRRQLWTVGVKFREHILRIISLTSAIIFCNRNIILIVLIKTFVSRFPK